MLRNEKADAEEQSHSHRVLKNLSTLLSPEEKSRFGFQEPQKLAREVITVRPENQSKITF